MKARAKEAAFYKGKRLRAGDAFEWEGDPEHLPKWAAPADAVVKPKAIPGGGDTKPKATQRAVKQKLGLNGDGVAAGLV